MIMIKKKCSIQILIWTPITMETGKVTKPHVSPICMFHFHIFHIRDTASNSLYCSYSGSALHG